jgi:hypothetical protein
MILSYYVSSRSEVRIVMPVTFSELKRYLCLFAYLCPTHIVLCFLFLFSSSCVPYLASFSGLSFFDCSFVIP